MRKQSVVGSALTWKDMKESTPSDWNEKISRHSHPGANLEIEQIHPFNYKEFVAQQPYCHEEIYEWEYLRQKKSTTSLEIFLLINRTLS